MKTCTVYVLTNRSGTLYTGVTNDLVRRVWEHRTKQVPGFSKRYNVTRLIYFEQTGSRRSAIEREKQIKRWSRKKKLWLVGTLNPELRDLAEPWFADDRERPKAAVAPSPGGGSLDSGAARLRSG